MPATVNNSPAATRIASASVWRRITLTICSPYLEGGEVLLDSGPGFLLSGCPLLLSKMSCRRSRYSSATYMMSLEACSLSISLSLSLSLSLSVSLPQPTLRLGSTMCLHPRGFQLSYSAEGTCSQTITVLMTNGQLCLRGLFVIYIYRYGLAIPPMIVHWGLIGAPDFWKLPCRDPGRYVPLYVPSILLGFPVLRLTSESHCNSNGRSRCNNIGLQMALQIKRESATRVADSYGNGHGLLPERLSGTSFFGCEQERIARDPTFHLQNWAAPDMAQLTLSVFPWGGRRPLGNVSDVKLSPYRVGWAGQKSWSGPACCVYARLARCHYAHAVLRDLRSSANT